MLDGRGCIPEVTDRTGRVSASQLLSFGRKVEADAYTYSLQPRFHPLARADCDNHWLAVCLNL